VRVNELAKEERGVSAETAWLLGLGLAMGAVAGCVQGVLAHRNPMQMLRTVAGSSLRPGRAKYDA
jgi:hypothetical protein